MDTRGKVRWTVRTIVWNPNSSFQVKFFGCWLCGADSAMQSQLCLSTNVKDPTDGVSLVDC